MALAELGIAMGERKDLARVLKNGAVVGMQGRLRGGVQEGDWDDEEALPEFPATDDMGSNVEVAAVPNTHGEPAEQTAGAMLDENGMGLGIVDILVKLRHLSE